nr:hypothetical protein [Tanacetum cinerariifolium]
MFEATKILLRFWLMDSGGLDWLVSWRGSTSPCLQPCFYVDAWFPHVFYTDVVTIKRNYERKEAVMNLKIFAESRECSCFSGENYQEMKTLLRFWLMDSGCSCKARDRHDSRSTCYVLPRLPPTQNLHDNYKEKVSVKVAEDPSMDAKNVDVGLISPVVAEEEVEL